MKKNRMMRLASVLLVLTLLTTSMISGTFAKYVSAGTAQDTARVAKWGVTVEASGSLFGRQYVGGELVNSVPTTSIDPTGISVAIAQGSAEAEKLVAPGTKSEIPLKFAVKGAPEVDSKISMKIIAKDIYLAEGTYGVLEKVSVNETNWASLIDAGLYYEDGTRVFGNYVAFDNYYRIAYTATIGADGYYPVQYSWTGQPHAENYGVGKIADIAQKLAARIDAGATDADTSTAGAEYTVYKNFEANTDLGAELHLDNGEITWEWVFGAAETEIGKEPTGNDAADTILGDLMAGSKVVMVNDDLSVAALSVGDKQVTCGGVEVGCLETKIDIAITVEQVD